MDEFGDHPRAEKFYTSVLMNETTTSSTIHRLASNMLKSHTPERTEKAFLQAYQKLNHREDLRFCLLMLRLKT